jgi:hypothetical protein
MKKLCVEIIIGEYVFYEAASVSIEKSWEFLSDTAVIDLPHRLLSGGKLSNYKNGDLRQAIKVSSLVKISLGYDYEMQTEFEGFVSSISPLTPVQIRCEDAAWLLRKTSYTKSWAQVSLRELLDYVIKPLGLGYEIAGETNLGKFSIQKTSAFDTLSELKKLYGISSYFKNGKLFCGFAYAQKGKNIQLDFQINIDPTSEQTLVYENESDKPVKLTATSFQSNGSKIQQVVGDAEGEERTLQLPLNLNDADVKKIAEEKLRLYKKSGYSGEVVVFGQPFIEHSDSIKIIDADYPERQGTFRVDKVSVNFGSNGFRRTVKLGEVAI